MIRPSCSYWLNVTGTPEDRERAKASLESHGIVPDLVQPVPPYNDLNTTDFYEVKDGSTEQFHDLARVMAAVAADCPHVEIVVTETCEEPHAPERVIKCRDGRLLYERLERTVDVAVQYDQNTVDACVRFLREQGFGAAADRLGKDFSVTWDVD